jgi:choline-sulfatase
VSKKKPNVLMLMGDQHPVFMTGCYGHSVVKTPTMDGIADQGITFDAAYCPSPLCAPSRAAMMTGRYPSVVEVWDNASPLRSDWPTFAHSFRAAGYRTILCGKMHFSGPDQHHGFEERWTQDIYPSTFDWTISNREKVHVKPRGTGQARHRVFESGVGWSPDMDYDEEVLFRGLNGLREIGRSEADEPFFLCVSFTGPHYPFYAPQKYWDLYSDDEIDMPKTNDDRQMDDHPIVQWIRSATHLEEPVPPEICRRARHATLGRITMLDGYLAQILDTLSDIGKEEETIVLYTSDHGDMMGEHGMWFKCTAYEWSSRVPLMIRGPGIPHGRRSAPVSLLDIGPTLCSLAGIEPVYPVSDGRDLARLIRGEVIDGEGEAIIEYYGDGTWRGWRTIRRGDLKLTFAPGFEPLLFDLKADPDERRDVAGDPNYQEIKELLLKRLLEDWDPQACDERRYQSEERRLSILKTLGAGQPESWIYPSPPVPRPGTGHSRKNTT